MIKILFVCHGSTADSRDLSVLVGQNGVNHGIWDSGIHSIFTFLGHLLRFRKHAFIQKHLLAVGKLRQVGEHPITGAERVVLADIVVDQQPDFFRQLKFFQPAGISLVMFDIF